MTMFLRKLILLGVLVVFSLSCGSLIGVTPTPILGPPARVFILTDEVYPPDWKALPCETDLCQNGDATYQQFFTPQANEPGQFVQEVYRYETVGAASEKYAIYRSANFHRAQFDPDGTEYAPPPELLYVSPIADEYYFACGHEFGLVCRMVARYRNYFVYFSFFMESNDSYGLTYTEVERILKWLDEQTASQLGLPLPTP